MCRKLLFLTFVLAVAVGSAWAEPAASSPDPPNNDWCVALDKVLSWVPGDGAASHDVYFGEYYADVANGDPSTYQGNFPMPTNSCDPGPLKKAKTYYWRVDAVGGTTIQGEVWAFTATANFCIKVDLAQVECANNNIIRPKTAKPGWWLWATSRWADLYGHDCSRACEKFPCPTGIAGTGVTARMTLGLYEGMGGLQVCGLTRCNLNATCGCPHPRALGAFGGDDAGMYYKFFDPEPGPICNTWYAQTDWPEMEWGNITLALHDLPAGAYVMYNYHNQFSQYRWPLYGQDNAVPSDSTDIDPPMPRIWAMSVKDARFYPGFSGDAFGKLFSVPWDGPWPEGVTSLQDACNVPIQNVLSDDELNPSEIKFATNGSPVAIMYKAGCCHPDPLRPSRVGGRGIMNAFVLMMMVLDTAYAPSPGNGAENVSPDVTLGWVAGQKAGSHDVYFGTSFADVRDATTSDTRDVYVGPQPAGDTDYDPPGLLEYGETYYWKVDEVNESDGDSPWYGEVWSFTTYWPYAGNVSPPDGATDQPESGVQLSWSAGYTADTHDLYLGTSLNDVANATTSSDEYVDSLPLATTTYGTDPLTIGKTYYWRVDEQNPSVAPYTWKGDVWEFEVKNWMPIDDFEPYLDDFDLLGTWTDGGFFDNGSVIGLGKLSNVPPDPVHEGAQSLMYLYDNMDSYGYGLPYYSEAYRGISNPSDWEALGVDTLTLWFYGDLLNDPTANDGMYVGLEDGRGAPSYAEVRYPTMADLKVPEWHQWDMALADFTGVLLNDVAKLYIGFGNRAAPALGSFGVAYFDDIRIYMPEVTGPACWDETQCHGDSDATNDVKGSDFLALKNSWYKVYPDPLYNPCADFDRNGDVKGSDFLILKNNWYQTVPADCTPGGTWPPF